MSIAWGDWDGDGDLDLAIGGRAQGGIYENNGGTLTWVWSSAWSTDGLYNNQARSLAWGDWDGDGDPDLAIGNSLEKNRVYRNDGGTLTSAWLAPTADHTFSVAWGDWDGDGDLDLAAGNRNGQRNRIYKNNGGTLVSGWSSSELDNTFAVDWGDWDGDGDLDLAVGNYGQPNRVYDNRGGTLTSAWTSADSDDTRGVAWGDWDGDGDLDLATGNWEQPIRVYENSGGTLTSAWLSAESERTIAVAWVDWDRDGDLDLVAASKRIRLYENRRGTLTSAWASAASFDHQAVALGDWDGDGDLDLAAASLPSEVYENISSYVADLKVTLDDGQPSATPGGNINYTLTVSNAGPLDGHGVQVATTLATALSGVTWTCTTGSGDSTCPASGSGDIDTTIDLERGSSVVFSITGAVDPAATGVLVSTATAALPAGPTEINPENNTATDINVLTPHADLGISKTDGVTRLELGGTVTYTIVATNAGPTNVTGARVTDAFPAQLSGCSWICTPAGGGSCSGGAGPILTDTPDLPAGGSATYQATCEVTSSEATGTLLVNTASIVGPSGIPAPDGNSANDTAADTDELVLSTSSLDFYSVVPCRLLDTRQAGQGPALASGEDRLLDVDAQSCGVPETAGAVVVNLTVVGSTAPGEVTAYPPGGPILTNGMVRFSAGQIRSNNIVLPLSADGSGSLGFRAFLADGGTVHLAVDVTGYYR